MSKTVNTVCSPPQALVSCLELLEDENVDTRVCGCKALACLKVGTHTQFDLLSKPVPVCQKAILGQHWFDLGHLSGIYLLKSCLFAACLCYVFIILTSVFHLLSFQAKESIDQLVYLCRTDKEEVRDAAKQTLLVLGNNNRLICQNDKTGFTKCLTE